MTQCWWMLTHAHASWWCAAAAGPTGESEAGRQPRQHLLLLLRLPTRKGGPIREWGIGDRGLHHLSRRWPTPRPMYVCAGHDISLCFRMNSGTNLILLPQQ